MGKLHFRQSRKVDLKSVFPIVWKVLLFIDWI